MVHYALKANGVWNVKQMTFMAFYLIALFHTHSYSNLLPTYVHSCSKVKSGTSRAATSWGREGNMLNAAHENVSHWKQLGSNTYAQTGERDESEGKRWSAVGREW